MKKNILILFQIITIILLSTKTVYASISLNYQELNIGIDVTENLQIIGSASGNVSWNNSQEKIAALNNGYVTGLSLGTTYITVQDDTSSSTCKVNVISNYIPVSSVSVGNKRNEILLNETINLNAEVSPTNASNKKIFYSSSDSSIATVDSNGNVTGKKAGSAIITLAAETKSTIYKVTVVEKINLNTITVSPLTLTLIEGNTSKLNISYAPSNATDKKVTWKSSNSKVATVDSSGNIKAMSPGTAVITATSNDGGHTSSSKITVNALDKTLKDISLNKTELSIKVGDKETISVNYNPTYAENKKVEWSSNNTRVASVENGVITAIRPGTVEIKAISQDGKHEATCKVTVLPLPIESIKFKEEKQIVVVGSELQLETISTPENTFIENPIWTSSDETVAIVKDGLLKTLKVGTTTITISDQEGKITASTEIIVIEKPAEALMIEVAGYDLNFNPSKKNYTLQIGNEKSLNISVNREESKVAIGGNRDLQNGSIITITINDKEKTTYVINIKKKNNNFLYFIIIITILLFINILRILKKTNKKDK